MVYKYVSGNSAVRDHHHQVLLIPFIHHSVKVGTDESLGNQ